MDCNGRISAESNRSHCRGSVIGCGAHDRTGPGCTGREGGVAVGDTYTAGTGSMRSWAMAASLLMMP